MSLLKRSLVVIGLCTLITGCSSSDDPTDSDRDLPLSSDQPENQDNNGIENEDSPTQNTSILTPSFEAGGDTDRLLNGIDRQVARTLLDLNARLRDGIELTNQQNICLGTYDPAVGQQLLAITCEQALATGDIPVYVHQAAFYDTADCQAAIFNGATSDCVLQTARISIRTEFITPERPADSPDNVPNRPQPVAGAELYYAINSTNLRLENTEAALTGTFLCDINLATNETSAPASSQSCASTIDYVANRFDALLTE